MISCSLIFQTPCGVVGGGEVSEDETFKTVLENAVEWASRRDLTTEDIEALGRLAVEWGLITEEALEKIRDHDLFEGNL